VRGRRSSQTDHSFEEAPGSLDENQIFATPEDALAKVTRHKEKEEKR
jgi:hypothetical protein